MLIQIIAAFFATIFFSIMFNVNKRQLLYCGGIGASGWAIYLSTIQFGYSDIMASFMAALVVSILSHALAIKRKNPVTTYQIAGIIPIVPGAYFYKSLLYLVNDSTNMAVKYLIQTMEIAGAIAIAMLIVSSFTRFFAGLKQKSKNRTI